MKKLRENVGGLEAVARLSPIFRLFGRRGRRLATHLEEVSGLSAQVERLSELPDRFNDVFAERGWIAYEMMKPELMEEALTLAGTGGLEEAEGVLADSYDAENLRFQMNFMSGIPEFRDRARLLDKACDDYLAGRYHACVPVVLALMDGFVDDVGEVNAGFFSKDANLTAWDSISAHDKGLQKLASVLGVGRKKTRVGSISVPYRNGILHGHDLGYDNKLVAAKCWAALFSLREWALARGDGRGPERETKEGLRETFRKLVDLSRQEAVLAAWEPRSVQELSQIPMQGDVEEYAEGTAERCVVEFLDGWRRGNFGQMARSVCGGAGPEIGRRAGQLRSMAEGRVLASFAIVEVKDVAAAIAEVEVELELGEGGEVRASRKTVRVLYADGAGQPKMAGAEAGSWRVVNLDVVW